MDAIKKFVGRFLLIGGLVLFVLSVIGGLILYANARLSEVPFAIAAGLGGAFSSMLICGMGVIIEELRDIKEQTN